ncbi:general secretion pathway protein GspD [Duganella ginsengisoli]|uniref:General secretion pathway protein GspD n=1 Tax=Pseudoduganella ginsengisoli TaxID=1462440 RepID=A0A6L6PZ70_9BURK|nr:general secretion pathway protein GspD [Pseudoduganella ginsengisoli]
MAALCAASLAGCAGPRAFREGQGLLAAGQYEQGLAQLEAAVQHEPGNGEYRLALASQRTSVINRLLAAADMARSEGRADEARQYFARVQSIEPANAMARQGLQNLAMDRQHETLAREAAQLVEEGSPASLLQAQDKLRQVLAENPFQRQALAVKERFDELHGRQARTDARLSARFQKPITLEFQDAPLRTILDAIAQMAGLNIFYDADVRPDLKGTLRAKDMSVEDCLNLLLTTSQLRQKVLSQNAVLIYPNAQQKVKDYQTLVVRTFILANADVKAVANSIKTIVKTQDLVVDERLGMLIMRDTPEAVRLAERLVALQDVGDPEVVLDVEIVEVKRSRLLELGIQWPTQLALSPLQLDKTPLTLRNLRGIRSATTAATIDSLRINARKEDQDGNILANPRIRVRNKEKAKVTIGDRVPVITTTSTNLAVTESVNYLDVGLKLEVEPTISLDDEVAIKVGLEVSNLVREVISKTGTLSYQIGARSANTVLRLKHGETQVLAGLISDEDRSNANKVPGAGELPLLGRLFGSQKDDAQRTEILLSITPRIVRAIRRPELPAAEFDAGTEALAGAKPLTLAPVVGAVPAQPAAAQPAAAQPAAAQPAAAQPAAAQPAAAQPAAAQPATAQPAAAQPAAAQPAAAQPAAPLSETASPPGAWSPSKAPAVAPLPVPPSPAPVPITAKGKTGHS